MPKADSPAPAGASQDNPPPQVSAHAGADTSVFIFDDNLRYTFVEGLRGEPIGYSREQLLGKTIYEVIPPALVPTVERHYRAALNGEITRFETSFKNKFYQVLVVPMYECGEVSGGMAIAQDVTQQRRLQQRLWESERKHRSLVETSHDMLWALDLEGRVTFINGAVRHMHGYEPEEVVGRSFMDFVAPESIEQAASGFRDMISGKEVFRYEVTHTRKDGSPVHILYNAVAARDEHGDVVGATGTAWDITHIKRAEEQLRLAHDQMELRVRERTAELEQANAKLRDSERYYRELLKEVDHRVRNNLSALLGLLTAMRQNTGDVQVFASAMEARLRAMTHIHQLLSETSWRPIELRALVESLAQVMRDFSGGNVCIRLDGPHAPISREKTLPLSMALLEWFTNSLKHGAHSSGDGCVEIGWELLPGDGATLVRLRWRECGGPPPARNIRESLGCQLVRSFVGRELRGRCVMSFPAGGAEHLIDFFAG